MDDKKETKKLDTKKIFVLGNGFDLAHYLPTAYVHFMDAMMVLESCEAGQELGFDDLFKNYLSDESSDRDKDFFSKTKELYKTDDLSLSIDTVKDLQIELKDNGWFQHFKHHLTDVDTWIDFENEIEEVLLTISVLLSKEFEHDTISNENTSMSENNYLSDNLANFSPKYLKEMKFNSTRIQRILREFSILFKVFSSYEVVEDYGKTKTYNHKSHFSSSEREKLKKNRQSTNTVFMEFDVNNVIDKKYLKRLSTVYIGFKEDEIFGKILNNLESFSKIFTIYINLVINQLKPAKPLDAFGDLKK